MSFGLLLGIAVLALGQWLILKTFSKSPTYFALLGSLGLTSLVLVFLRGLIR